MQNHISLPFYRSPTIASLQLIIKKNGSQPMHRVSGVAGIGSCCGQSRPLESWMSRDQHLHLHSLEAIRHQVCCVTSSHVSFQILSVKLRQRWLHLRDFCQLSTPLVAFLEGDKASRLRQWETVFTSSKKIHLAADHPTTMGTFHRKV